MKAYCKNCLSIQPSSFRNEKDAVTGANYEDLCCDSCHFVVATIQERETAAQPADWVELTDEERREIWKGCDPTHAGYVTALVEAKMREKNAITTPPAKPADYGDELTIAYMSGVYDGKKMAKREAEQEASPGGVLFAVEEAIRNGDCPFAIEIAFDAYEAERLAKLKEKNT
jgi:predicted Fe-S protein YdhL (DUF1289 family)